MANGRLLVQRFCVARCRRRGGLEGVWGAKRCVDVVGYYPIAGVGRRDRGRTGPSFSPPWKGGAGGGSARSCHWRSVTRKPIHPLPLPSREGRRFPKVGRRRMSLRPSHPGYSHPGGGRGPVGTSDATGRSVDHCRPPTGPRPSPGWGWWGWWGWRGWWGWWGCHVVHPKRRSPAKAGAQDQAAIRP